MYRNVKITKLYYLRNYTTDLYESSLKLTNNKLHKNFIWGSKVMERREIQRLFKTMPALIDIFGLNIIWMWCRTISTFQVHWFLAVCLKSANARRIGHRIWSKSNNKSFEKIGFIEMTTSVPFGLCTSP